MSYMDSFKEELKSGKFSIYGQWLGLFSGIILVLFGIFKIFSLSITSMIVSITFGAIVLFLEIPFFIKIFRTGQRFESFLAIFENHYFRAALYIAGAIVNFIFTNVLSFVFLGSLTLLISGVCYGLAGLKHQERTTSRLTGGAGLDGFETLA